MARRVFFSFHYQEDIARVNQVRKSGQFQGVEGQQFYDRSLWEKTRLYDRSAIQRMIDNGLKGTSCTVVLIGTETYDRPWVNYEIRKSFVEGKGLLGVRIHSLKNFNGLPSRIGKNPLERLTVRTIRGVLPASRLFRTYDWVTNYGMLNLSNWIEEAIRLRSEIR